MEMMSWRMLSGLVRSSAVKKAVNLGILKCRSQYSKVKYSKGTVGHTTIHLRVIQ